MEISMAGSGTDIFLKVGWYDHLVYLLSSLTSVICHLIWGLKHLLSATWYEDWSTNHHPGTRQEQGRNRAGSIINGRKPGPWRLHGEEADTSFPQYASHTFITSVFFKPLLFWTYFTYTWTLSLRFGAIIKALHLSSGRGKSNTLQYSCLYPMDRGAWRAAVHRVTKSQMWLSRYTDTDTDTDIPRLHFGLWSLLEP